MIWTDDQINELKRLWARGDSAAIIGAELGVTRSAVCGKVHRLGLSYRSTVSEKPYERQIAAYFRPDKAYTRPSRSKTAIAARKAASLNIVKPAAATMKPNAQTFSFKAKLPEMTKSELRAMLAEAVRNTAAMA